MTSSGHASGDDRSQLHERVEALREQGVIDAGDENAIIRHCDEASRDLKAEFQQIVEDYKRRIEADGESDANVWLKQSVEQAARRHKANTGQLLSSVFP